MGTSHRVGEATRLSMIRTPHHLDCVDPPAINRADPRNVMAGWYFSEQEIVSALSAERMLNPSIDLSNPCNLNCPYCFIEEKNSKRKVRRPDELTLEETISILDDYASAGAMTVNIVGAGEPTIDPHFRTILRSIHERRMTPVVFTNGIRIADCPELAGFLAEQNATVVLKYNATDEKTQDLVSGRKGYTKKRDRALELLLLHCLNAKVPTRLALDIIAFRGNYSQLEAIHRFCRQRNILPILGDFIPTGRTESGAFVGEAALENLPPPDRVKVIQILQPLSAAQRTSVYERLARIDRDDFGIVRTGDAAYYSGLGCTQILGLYTDIRGNIWPCVARSQRVEGNLVPGFLGNVRRGDLPSEVWRNHPYLARVRQSYTGACPYKPEVTTLTVSASSAAPGYTYATKTETDAV